MAQNGNLHGREKNSLKVEKLFLEGCISKEKKVGSNGETEKERRRRRVMKDWTKKVENFNFNKARETYNKKKDY